MPRTYQLRVGEVGGKTYKPKKRERKRKVPSSQEVRSIIEESVVESTQRSSQCAASLPGIISSQVMVPAESSGALVVRSSQEPLTAGTAPTQGNAQGNDYRQWREEKWREKQQKEEEEPDRSRCFILTFNTRLEEACQTIQREECKYLRIGGIERAPSTGHCHQHCVIYFQNARYANSMRNKYKMFGDVKAVKMKEKDIAKTFNYVVKEKEIVIEKGQMPKQGYHTELEREILTHESAKDFKFDRPDLYARHRNGINEYYDEKNSDALLDQIFNECITGEIHTKKINIVYIEGKSGTGKTTSAPKYAAETFGYVAKDMGYLKFDGSFCTGRRLNAKCLFWREFRSDQLPAAGFYQLCDKLGYSINVKHGSEFIRPETIIFDSIIPLDKIYKDETGHHRYQIFRRITHYVEYNSDHTFTDLSAKLQALQEKYKPRDKTNDDEEKEQ